MSRIDGSWIAADEAARTLDVSRSTLYAYVSRGFIRSQPSAGPSRERRYSRDDVDRLRRRAEGRRDPDRAAAHALRWGMPILESAITLIDNNRLYYRGHDAVELSRTRSLADVASLIWTGQFDAPMPAPSAGVSAAGVERDVPFAARAQIVLARAASRDPHAFDLRPEGIARTGWRILHRLAATAAPPAGAGGGVDLARGVEHALARAWRVRSADADILRAALILCADHELNVSSFTARCVASAGSNPYAVVIAGLAALEGTRHGGASVRAESMLQAFAAAARIRPAILDRLRRGDSIDGFGHPLYRDGDPRAAALLRMLRERHRSSAELAFVLRAATAVEAITHEKPTVDFGLAAAARVLRLPAGAPLILFALGRTIGWIGQAIEQYATGQIIRPRAKYVGTMPAAS